MIFVHWIIWLVILSYLVFKKRNVDFYTIAVFGYLFYTLPAFWGTTWTTQELYYSKIHFGTYLVVDIVSVLIFVSMVYFDYRHYRRGVYFEKKREEIYPSMLFYILVIIAYLFILVAVHKIGFELVLSQRKDALDIELMNPFFSLAVWISLIVLSFSSYSKNWRLLVLSSPILLFTLFLGIRSYFVIGTLSYALLYMAQLRNIQLFKLWKVGVWLIVFGIIATMYRAIYTIIKKGDFQHIILLLTTKEFYLEKVFTLPHEIYIVFSTLNISVSSNLRLGIEFVWYQIVNFIPLMNNLFNVPEVRYSKVIMEEFYFESKFGMASNIWAEMYSSGGLILVVIFALIWLQMIKYFNLFLINENKIGIFFIPFGIYFAFYINRLSFALAIGDVKYIIFISFISMTIYHIMLKPFMKKRPSRRFNQNSINKEV